jgi:hypothetical protein
LLRSIKYYTCSCCGKRHEEWPALTFISPDNYHNLPETFKNEIAEIDEDFCVINHPGQTDRFARVTLIQKVTDHCDDLHYGLWVSLSEKSFLDYSENFRNENHVTKYFGWLCNALPEYDFKESIPTTVYTKTGNNRPEIVPHSDFKHPFVFDYYNGITKEEAERRIEKMLGGEKKKINKPWWRIWQ